MNRQADFFERLEAVKKCVLLLDYDGTLAPFRKDRSQAFLSAPIHKLLQKLVTMKGIKVVIISGRKLSDLIQLLRVKPLPELWGSHGKERRLKNGGFSKSPLLLKQKEGLRQAAILATLFVPNDWLEKKPFSLAVHGRGRSPKIKERVFAAIKKEWEKLQRPFHLELHPFNEGLELRVKGKNKGDAVRAILKRRSPKTPAVYLGDDRTDEDAFRAIKKMGGLALKVGEDKRKTEAHARLKSEREVISFLQGVVRFGKR